MPIVFHGNPDEVPPAMAGWVALALTLTFFFFAGLNAEGSKLILIMVTQQEA